MKNQFLLAIGLQISIAQVTFGQVDDKKKESQLISSLGTEKNQIHVLASKKNNEEVKRRATSEVALSTDLPQTSAELGVISAVDTLSPLDDFQEVAEKGKLSISGYIDSYYFTNFNNPASRDNMGVSGVGRGFDRKVDQFALGMVQTIFTYSNDKSEAVLDLADTLDIAVIEDAAYQALRYDGEPVAPIQALEIARKGDIEA